MAFSWNQTGRVDMSGARRVIDGEAECVRGAVDRAGIGELRRNGNAIRGDGLKAAARRHRRQARGVCGCRIALRRSAPAARRGRPPVDGAVRRPPGNRERNADPRVGGLVDVDRLPHRILAIVRRRVLAVHAASGAVYLAPDDELVLALPTIELWQRMVGSGRIVDAGTGNRVEGGRAEGIIAQCDLLDGAGVGNGCKAIAIYMHANWRGELVRRFGPASPAATLKRWRTLRARGEHHDAASSRRREPAG